MDIKRILEKLVEGKISLEEAWVLIDPENSSENSRKYSKTLTNHNNEIFFTVRMF